ncbi:MAG TPA: DUF5666 domain-containing protein [Jatrophihabitans sp.]|nr:DUF5666 domain-containing protein [Jatrophihabitans sp.]
MNRLTRPRLLAHRGAQLGSAAALLLAAGLLVACGGSSSASSPTVSQQSTGAAGPSDGRGGFGGGAPPGASGVLAEVTGNSLEVQNQTTGQVTVTFTASTAFSQSKTVPLSALKVGDCVTAVAVRAQNSGSPSAAPSSPAGPLTSFTANSVQISAPVNGSCDLTGFGGGRVRPSGTRTAQPGNSGFPRPSGSRGNFGGGFGGFGLATGTVTQLTGTTMLVQTIARGQQASMLDTITLTDATTFTEDAKVNSSALKVGQCVTATGSTDSTGAVTATRIALSTAGPNGCSSGFSFGGRLRPSASTSGA